MASKERECSIIYKLLFIMTSVSNQIYISRNDIENDLPRLSEVAHLTATHLLLDPFSL